MLLFVTVLQKLFGLYPLFEKAPPPPPVLRGGDYRESGFARGQDKVIVTAYDSTGILYFQVFSSFLGDLFPDISLCFLLIPFAYRIIAKSRKLSDFGDRAMGIWDCEL